MNPTEDEKTSKKEDIKANVSTNETSNATAENTENSQENSLEDIRDYKALSNVSNASSNQPEPPKNGPLTKAISIFKKFDIYFVIFIFLIIVSVVVAYIAVQKNKAAKTINISTQTLDQNALKQINGNDIQVGGTNQTLDIQSSTVFGSNVLVKNNLQVAGTLQIAGSLSLPGITVSGITNLGQINATSLTLTGTETVKGQLIVNQGMTVNGVASFSGPLNASVINVTSLQVNGDITFNHHVYTSGGLPRISSTSAIGAGGTSSINGTDTAGNININSGSGVGAGCLINVTFVQQYAVTPYIEITPVGQAAGSNIGYYVTRSTSGFSICANSPPSDTAMSFDYYVTG